ncbi:sulfite exporter TauE/SafE family protein [Thiomicrorhabdus heinhorstiae]|uniref:Probable membrane transporter protein n=1 Tax=Thiomicrorhabdus heinhorstiae TaxID=2748010 RepID=A0ABS0BZP0_9GAMM|nr:sulfite exporter TauE/SafE family protein [Thiomicrorhabdus heinhorstiae]MBF6058929.1 sulfite exporter TauE/SafE family protein [Thiomicrorhabdus heinhorstiae]
METSFVYEIIIYLITGAVAGFAAGLLGIGGGLLIVPVLTTVFAIYLPGSEIVHLAIGTSLATILITSLSSVKAHHGHGAVRWDIVKMLAGGVFIGAFFGGWSSQFVPSNYLGIIFGILELLIALNMLLAFKPQAHRQLPGIAGNSVAGALIGQISSLVGVGGGTLTTPYLVWNNVSMHQAIATSTAVSLPVALAGTFGFLIGGMNATSLPAYATGYIYWPAFLGIIVASVVTAPLGAKLAHQLPVKLLKRYFGILLILLAAKMLFFSHT